jgi:serine/threonine protein kinase/tetratricopeptide (TPR) repeat protein
MTSDPSRSELLFGQAIAIESVGQRNAFLDQACPDPELRQAVGKLVADHFRAGAFLELPAAALAAAAAELDTLGTVIGNYRLHQRIGEGGFGIVYRAEQLQPVRRDVALKILKPGMDTRHVVARFEMERQALAVMDHPHIAKVLDAGETETGRPFFVMELVSGLPITDYCDRAKLKPRQRLELFTDACQAVQHAHHKGIIHRDLKPSNILVAEHDNRPSVTVIDFGIAKATSGEFADQTVLTGAAQVIGTPLYMSPEQAGQSRDIDVRSDVYSLGVVLYELLTGTTPFEKERLRDVGADEVRRIIREEEPPKPSTRMSTLGQDAATVSANRQCEPRRLRQMLSGDLDWIVMKCLEKDRNRRYETVNGFAMDVQRYLADEPVLARPPSLVYRLRKFVRRNKGPVLTAGVVVLAALLAAGSLGWASRDRAARQAEAERENAEREAETNRQMDLALQEAGLLRDRGDWPKANAAVQRMQWLLAGPGGAAHRQRVQTIAADLQMVLRLEEIRLGDPRMTLYSLDRSGVDAGYDEAFKEYGIDMAALDARTAAERIRASDIRGHLAAALDDWMWAKLSAIRNWQLHRQRPDAKAKDVKLRGDYQHLRAVADLAVPDERCRDIRDPQVQESKRAVEALADRTDVGELPSSSAMLLARLLVYKGAPDKAVAVLHAAHARSPDDFLVNFELAVVVGFNKARQEEALGFMRAAVVLRPQYATLHLKLGDMLNNAKRPDQAIASYRAAFELQPDNNFACGDLGRALEAQDKLDEALTVYVRHAAATPNKSGGHSALGDAYLRRRQWNKAIAAWQEAVRWSPKNFMVYRKLAWLLLTCPDARHRDPNQAVIYAQKAVEFASKSVGYQNTLGVAHLAAGDSMAARAAIRTALELRPDDLEQCFVHAAMLLLTGDSQGYQQFCAHLLKRGDNLKCLDQPGRRSYLTARLCLLAPEAVADAAVPARLATEALKAAPTFAYHLHTLGLAEYRAGRHQEAIKRFKESLDANPRWPGRPSNLMALAMAHHCLGHADQAQRCFDEAVQRMDDDRDATPALKSAELHPHDWLAWLILRREAEALISGGKK